MSIIRQTGRPGATFNLIDPVTGKIIVTAVADAKGVVTLASVPAGQWKEQIIYTQVEDPTHNKTITQTSPIATDFSSAQGLHGPVVTSPDGSVWQINVSNAGTLSATKLA